jgi:two-component system phosphate regulon sensor histidine kinase PhoR
VSHELRTPVTAIRSAAETLRSSAINDPKMAAMFLDIVDRNAQRLGDLVEDLLDLSRIESKAYKLALEELSVSQVASYCLSLFRERADKKHLQLSMQVPEDLPNVRADRRALEQVLTNLIDNAVKYCPDGREIAIAAEPSGNYIRITVRDSGQGIDEKHLPRLFERFYRVDPGRARESGGTGLGLSIAKHLVEAMGGTISVESKPGKGTAFHLGMQRA